MTKEEIDKLEARFESIQNSFKYADRYFHILSGKIEYTNDDINELITFFSQKEKYEACERLVKLIK